MIYYKLDILLKIIRYEVMTMENERCHLQSGDNCKLQKKVQDRYVYNIIYSLFLLLYFVP